jgi:hypothetical protein
MTPEDPMYYTEFKDLEMEITESVSCTLSNIYSRIFSLLGAHGSAVG